HPLADAQRLLGQFVQRLADGPDFGGFLVGLADLAEDLRFADDHRVQPGRHREQVLDRRAGVVDVEVVGQVADLGTGVPGQHPDDLVQPPVEGLRDRVHLHPVAGGEHESFSDLLVVQQLPEDLGQVVGADRNLLQHPHRSAVVRNPDGEQVHGRTTIPSTESISSGTWPPASGGPTSAAADDSGCSSFSELSCCRRATWNDKICISTARSTLRTSTFSGTWRTTGAKFKMHCTPPATRRSQTSWAPWAGVAMTPMVTSRSAQTRTMSSTWFT